MKCISAPVGCGRDISNNELRVMDDLTYQEWLKSGLCAGCQDEIFGPSEPDYQALDLWDDEEYEYGPLTPDYENDCRD